MITLLCKTSSEQTGEILLLALKKEAGVLWESHGLDLRTLSGAEKKPKLTSSKKTGTSGTQLQGIQVRQ